MNKLSQRKCVPCEGGVSPLDASTAETLHKEVPEWSMFTTYLTRTFSFKDFVQAMDFANAVARIAEEEGHHPDITITYNKVTLTLSTHAIAGLSENDFILAAKIDVVSD